MNKNMENYKTQYWKLWIYLFYVLPTTVKQFSNYTCLKIINCFNDKTF